MIIRCKYSKIVPIAELNLNPKNRNKHPAEQIERLAAILIHQGWRYCVKVSNQSGLVTSGHGRIEAALLNGWKSVPVDYQDYDTPEQEYADSVADNAIALEAELDLAGIQTDVLSMGSDFNVDMLGKLNFHIGPMDFDPGDESEQGQLDQKKPITCPNCGEEFVNKG
jgi:hypothetical protein